MSWKTACLLVNQGGPGYLAGLPLHDGNRARDLLPELGLVATPHSRFATLEAGLSPPDGYYCLGVYPKAVVVAGLDELYGAVERPQRPLVERCLARFPRAETLLVELAGGVGLASFALWSEGRLFWFSVKMTEVGREQRTTTLGSVRPWRPIAAVMVPECSGASRVKLAARAGFAALVAPCAHRYS